MDDEGKEQVTFRLPEPLAGIADGGGGADDGRYELWSVQLLGDGLTLQDLDGTHCSIDVSAHTQGSDGGGDEVIISAAIQASTEGQKYVLQVPPNGLGVAANDSMRLIYPAKKKRRVAARSASVSSDTDSDSDDDDDSHDGANDEFSHRPSRQQFVRHCSIISHHRPAEEPSSKDGGSPPRVAIRRAYEPVPQRSGLKRRWVPFGGCHTAAVAVAVASHRGRSESVADGERAVETGVNSATEGDDATANLPTREKSPPIKAPPARQEAGQATAAHQPEPRSSASSPAPPERSLDPSDKASKKAAKKEAKRAAKEEKKKKEKKEAKKMSKQEAP
jgi:hypothetical protein